MRTWLPLTLLAVGACTDAASKAAPDDTTPMYLALGDSVAFGYDPLVDMTANKVRGYPEVLGERRGIEVVNASCPGEATGGFMSPTGNDNNCRENRVAYPLHVAYDTTQLRFALDFLAEHPATELVTIDIGGNDASKLNDICAGDLACVVAGFLPMMTEYGTNLDFIFGEIRKVYDGPLVALAIYNPYPNETVAQYGLDRLNAVLAEKLARVDGIYADGMAAFHQASGGADACTAGLIIPMGNGTCDIHPSPAGDAVLADAIEIALAR